MRARGLALGKSPGFPRLPKAILHAQTPLGRPGGRPPGRWSERKRRQFRVSDVHLDLLAKLLGSTRCVTGMLACELGRLLAA